MIYYGCPKCETPMSSPDSMAGRKESCPGCGNVVIVPGRTDTLSATTPSPPPPLPMIRHVTSSPARRAYPVCQHCGARMRKSHIGRGSCLAILIGLATICVGVIMLIVLPVIGWIIGPAMIVIGLLAGGKRSKVWKCTQCGIVVSRA